MVLFPVLGWFETGIKHKTRVKFHSFDFMLLIFFTNSSEFSTAKLST